MSCTHVSDYKKSEGTQLYETLLSLFISTKLSPPYYQQTWVLCQECNSYDCRLFCCMHCIYFGCMEKHVSLHFSDNPDHYLFIEMSNGNIMCVACQDYMYDPEFEEVIRDNILDKVGGLSSFDYEQPRDHKMVRVSQTSTVGIRGMVNLGNTCYMNCVMQALLHTPMLRDYFFTDKHSCQSKQANECFYCQVAEIFQRYYSDSCPRNICLNKLLYLVWQNDSNLFGSGQKDAHEFFICARNLLHQFSSVQNTQGRCNCIVHIIFHGTMQSDLVCKKCSNVSTKIDPLWEISLDIPEAVSDLNLAECLFHFTRLETLDSSVKVECGACKSFEEVTKQLTFKVLPLIMVIQLKRFETVDKIHKKKSLSVKFPDELDMSPYMSDSRNQNEHSTLDYTNRYTLYAVVEHEGDLQIGHYLAYIRRTYDVWFQCSDTNVSPVSKENVLKSEGYLLFYHKTLLPYD